MSEWTKQKEAHYQAQEKKRASEAKNDLWWSRNWTPRMDGIAKTALMRILGKITNEQATAMLPPPLRGSIGATLQNDFDKAVPK